MIRGLTGVLMIVALAGLPRTGKTTLARLLAETIPGVLLDKAELQRVLFPKRGTTSPELNDRLYEFMLQATVWNLETAPEGAIVLDGRPLTRTRDVLSLRRFSSGIGQMLHIVECLCPDDVALQRSKGSAGYATDELAEPIPGPKIVVDTRQVPDRCLRTVLEAIRTEHSGVHPVGERFFGPEAAAGVR